MERECFVVTDNSYFHLGVSGLINGYSENTISKLSLDCFFKTGCYVDSDFFFVCFDDIVSNFKALLFFDGMNNDVMFFSKNNKVVKLCLSFGFNSAKIETAMDINVMFRKRDRKGYRKKVLSNMECNVITKLLDGDSNIKLATKKRLSAKTISHHKRSALLKVGLDDISSFFDNINKDIFELL